MRVKWRRWDGRHDQGTLGLNDRQEEEMSSKLIHAIDQLYASVHRLQNAVVNGKDIDLELRDVRDRVERVDEARCVDTMSGASHPSGRS
jgi:hypothetical protein